MTDLARRVVEWLDLPGSVHNDVTPFDKYRLQAEPSLLRAVAAAIADKLPADAEVLVGTELAGVPLAVAISLHTGLPWAVLRTRASAAGPVAGTYVADRRAVLVKDMTRMGHAMAGGVRVLRDAGAIVTDAVAAICWDPAAIDVLRSIDVTLTPALHLADLRVVWRAPSETSDLWRERP